jgi:uncharacterized protein (DUF1800 family)
MPVWNTSNMSHLLSRSLFGFSKSDLTMALGYSTFADFIDKALLKDSVLPAAPNSWVTTVPAQVQLTDGSAFKWYSEMTAWWYSRMVNEGLDMREKMVLFLHNHFSNDRDKVSYPQNMYVQNQLFRKYAFGNFKQLVKDVSIDPAMLIYLDGNNSRGAGPNENYAREVMELFTMGIGNYTETDIKQAAKVFSGWQVSGLTSTFTASRWYTEANVTIFGKTAKFDLNTLIDHIFDQKATAQFICRKLYQEFVYYKPDEVFISKMATVFKANNFEMKPLLKFLFTSDEFYKTEIIGSKIKNPTELLVGSAKLLQVKTPDLNNFYELARTLQMQLFQPPNVAGWPGQREWISSTTYSYRGGFTDSLLSGKRYNGVTVTSKLDPIPFARTFPTSEKANEFVDEIVGLALRFPLSDTRRKFLLDTLLDGTIVANYNTYIANTDTRINKFLKALMRLPEYQLC